MLSWMVYIHIHFNDTAAMLITQLKLVALRNWSLGLKGRLLFYLQNIFMVDRHVTVVPLSIKY